jgi:SAM-dependent methyltransferase
MQPRLTDDSLVLHWERMDFHRSYVADAVRNDCYAAALDRHARGRTVVDVGSGTGILAMLAARAGAAAVTGIEWSSLADTAARAVADNGLDDRVEIVRGDARDFTRSQRADLIVHDLIGSFVWDEDALDVMRGMRDRVLVSGGRIIPGVVELHIVPITWPDRIRFREFWARPHAGLNLSAFLGRDRQFAPADGPTVVHLGDDACLLAEPSCAAITDFAADETLPPAVTRHFTMARSDHLDAVLGFLRIHFDDHVVLSTAPGQPATSWGQVVVPLAQGMPVRRGQEVAVTFTPALRGRAWTVDVTPNTNR